MGARRALQSWATHTTRRKCIATCYAGSCIKKVTIVTLATPFIGAPSVSTVINCGTLSDLSLNINKCRSRLVDYRTLCLITLLTQTTINFRALTASCFIDSLDEHTSFRNVLILRHKKVSTLTRLTNSRVAFKTLLTILNWAIFANYIKAIVINKPVI